MYQLVLTRYMRREEKHSRQKEKHVQTKLGRLLSLWGSSAQLGGAEECSFFLTLQPPVI